MPVSMKVAEEYNWTASGDNPPMLSRPGPNCMFVAHPGRRPGTSGIWSCTPFATSQRYPAANAWISPGASSTITLVRAGCMGRSPPSGWSVAFDRACWGPDTIVTKWAEPRTLGAQTRESPSLTILVLEMRLTEKSSGVCTGVRLIPGYGQFPSAVQHNSETPAAAPRSVTCSLTHAARGTPRSTPPLCPKPKVRETALNGFCVKMECSFSLPSLLAGVLEPKWCNKYVSHYFKTIHIHVRFPERKVNKQNLCWNLRRKNKNKNRIDCFVPLFKNISMFFSSSDSMAEAPLWETLLVFWCHWSLVVALYADTSKVAFVFGHPHGSFTEIAGGQVASAW